MKRRAATKVQQHLRGYLTRANFHRILFSHSLQKNISKMDNLNQLTRAICANLIRFSWHCHIRLKTKLRLAAEEAERLAAEEAAKKKAKKKKGKKGKKKKGAAGNNEDLQSELDQTTIGDPDGSFMSDTMMTLGEDGEEGEGGDDDEEEKDEKESGADEDDLNERIDEEKEEDEKDQNDQDDLTPKPRRTIEIKHQDD